MKRNFSANTEAVTQILRNETLVSLGTIHDAVKSVDLADFMVPKELLVHCRGARRRYEKCLEDIKKEKQENVTMRKRLMVLEKSKRKET